MRNNDYRELQLSSTHLILIFFGLILLGVIIFLLGISVGKKQNQVLASQQELSQTNNQNQPEIKYTDPKTKQTNTTLKKEQENKEQKKVIPEAIEKQKPQAETKVPQTEKKPVVKETSVKTKTSTKKGFFIQIGAYSKKEGAITLAEQIKKKGFPIVVVDPTASGGRFYRVRAGGYSTREEALTALSRLAKVMGKKTSDYFIKYVK